MESRCAKTQLCGLGQLSVFCWARSACCASSCKSCSYCRRHGWAVVLRRLLAMAAEHAGGLSSFETLSLNKSQLRFSPVPAAFCRASQPYMLLPALGCPISPLLWKLFRSSSQCQIFKPSCSQQGNRNHASARGKFKSEIVPAKQQGISCRRVFPARTKSPRTQVSAKMCSCRCAALNCRIPPELGLCKSVRCSVEPKCQPQLVFA